MQTTLSRKLSGEPRCFVYTMVKAKVLAHEHLDLGYLRCLVCDGNGHYKIGSIEKRCYSPPTEMDRPSGKDLVALTL